MDLHAKYSDMVADKDGSFEIMKERLDLQVTELTDDLAKSQKLADFELATL
jgi:hypothetical protein